MQAASKVGLFVIVFVGLLLGAYALLEKSLFAKPNDVYYADFKDAGGVTTGSAVLLAGVKVGQVKEVKLLGPSQARLTLEVEKGTQLPVGSSALIPASFVSLGDQKIQIVAPPTTPTGWLSPGATVPGRLGSPLESFGPEGKDTLAELTKTMQSVQGLLGDKGLRQDLHQLMATVTDTSKKFGTVASRVDGLVASSQGQFQAMLRSTSVTLSNMQVVSGEVRKLVASGELQGKTTALLDNLNLAVKKGTQLVEELQSFAGDPEMRASMKDAMANLKVMSDSGTKIAANAEVMSANGVEISEKTSKLMDKANHLADQVDELIQKFNKTVDKFAGPAKSLATGIEYEATLAQETDPGRLRADANVFVPFGKDKVMFGLFDAFETNKVNLQLQKQVNPNLGLRYGAYASKPGIGVDYQVGPRLGLRGDLFGLNDPRLDLRLNYRLGSGLAGWVGVNKVFERNAPSIGVTVRK
ncbi:MAG: MCE family protein [Armatimonadetes bacterium]|nr:MCE family protein [Armatimonadota bacterium]